MSAPVTGFPYYKKGHSALYAFLAKDEMYRIAMEGSNTNEGCVVDHYITRNMVLKHWPYGHQALSPEEFQRLYKQLFDKVLEKMII